MRLLNGTGEWEMENENKEETTPTKNIIIKEHTKGYYIKYKAIKKPTIKVGVLCKIITY